MSSKFIKYGELYAALALDGARSINYMLINVFLTLEGVRPACIINMGDEVYSIFKRLFDEKRIGIIPYPTGINSYLVIGPKAKQSSLAGWISIIRAGVSPTSTPEQRRVFHTTTGEILGYMTPLDIMGETSGKKTSITAYVDGKEVKGIMPQIVSGMTDEAIEAYYEPALKFLLDVHTNPHKYDYFPLKFTSPPELLISTFAKGGRRQGRRRRITRKIKR